MGFNSIPRKKVMTSSGFPRRRSMATSVTGRLYETAMENTYVTPRGRRSEYRPSSFPACSILTYRNLVKGASQGFFEAECSAAGDYFTGVGTYAHENIQFHMGFSGKTFGDWKCRNIGVCSKANLGLDLYDENGKVYRKGKLTTKNTCKNTCPKCNQPMEYIEKEINYRGLKGHIDCIVRMDDGRYWVSDYKTCTKNKLTSGKIPAKEHLKQLPTYCYVLKKKYGLDIAGFSLLYFSRDNPFEFYEYSEKWTPKWDKKCKALILDERLKFKAGTKSFGKLDPAAAIKQKPCKTLAFYEKEIAYYTPCPMLDVCFSPRKLERALLKYTKEWPSKPKARQKIIEAINID